MDWKDEAACRDMDTDAFLKEDPWCLEICAGCQVKVECLKYGLTTDSQGIWGGTTTHDRQDFRQRKTLLDGQIQVVWDTLT